MQIMAEAKVEVGATYVRWFKKVWGVDIGDRRFTNSRRWRLSTLTMDFPES